MDIVVKQAMEKISENVYEKWYRIIQEQWYDAYSPSVYERQYAILKSLIKTDVKMLNGVVWFEVYIDENIMNHYHPTQQEKRSSSSKWGKDGDEILNIIEKIGFSFSSIERKPIHSYEQVVDWLRANFDKDLKIELSKLGKVL